MNPAPDADLHSVGEFYHRWVTEAVANLVFKRIEEPQPAPRYRWDALLNPEPKAEASPQALSAVASVSEQASRTIIPQPVREIPADIAAGVADLVEGAAKAVSEIVGSSSDTDEPKVVEPKQTRAASAKSKAPAKRSAAPRSKKPTTGA